MDINDLAIGTKFEVVRGGGKYHLRKGQIWELAESEHLGVFIQKKDCIGGFNTILNGRKMVMEEFIAGRMRYYLGEPIISDKDRIDWLEQTIQGTGNSKFLRSIFISQDLCDRVIALDVKTEQPVFNRTLRGAIDEMMRRKK